MAMRPMTSHRTTMTRADIVGFARRYPEIGGVVQDLARLAPNAKAREAATSLLAEVGVARLAMAGAEAK